MQKTISLLILAFIIFITSCSPTATPPPPTPSQPTDEVEALAPTPTFQPSNLPTTPTATPTPEPQPLPPFVLRTSPEAGQEQPLDAPVEITFDQPMDRASVEKAFAIEPGASVDGTFTWTDDQTVQFTPKNGFKRGERYRVRVVESAQSQARLAMQRPFELRFSALGSLEVTNVQPANDAAEILPDTIVTVLFNRPVVPLNAIEDAASLPDPLTFTPPVTGQGEWLNTSIYQFTPAGEGFKPATTYTARVGQGLKDALGQTELADDYEWTFTTVTPAAAASLPANGDVFVSPTPIISLTFNQKMDRASVEAAFKLVNDSTGETIPGEFAWADTGLTPPTPGPEDPNYYDYVYDEGSGPETVGVETVQFTPATTLDFETVYRIELPAGVKGTIGEAETQNDYSASFTVTPYPAVISSYPADGDEAADPYGSLQITFNAPINPDSVVLGENLIIQPPVSATQVYSYWWSSNTSFDLNFPVEASSSYRVTLGADIEGRYGQQLGAPTTIAWTTRAADPLLFMHTPGRIATYNAYTDTLTFVTVRNLSRVDFGLYRLPLDDFIQLNGTNWWDVWDQYFPDEANLITDWAFNTTPELNSSVIYRVDLGERSGLGDRLPPGLYYLEATADAGVVYPEAQSSSFVESRERQILVVSQNNIILKTSGSESLAWVTDLQTGQPVPDLPLTFVAGGGYDYELGQTAASERLGQASTDKDGVAKLEYDSRPDAYEPRIAIVGDANEPDENFAVTVSNWTDGIDRYSFNNVSVEDYQQPYNAHFYTDRKIYRPGQSVYFKGVLRADDDARYSLPTTADTVNIYITDSQGKEVFNEDFPLSEMGSVNGEFQLDENAVLGSYSVQATYDTDNTFYGDFQVAAYRKPEYIVEASTDKPEYANGETIKVTTTAQFFFGGPVSNAKVKWTVLSDDYSFSYTPPLEGGGVRGGYYDFTDYDFSRSDAYNYGVYGEQIAEGEGMTDAEGRFTFEVDADIAERIASQNFTFDITITDLNNQEVATQASAVVHKGDFYIGLSPEEYVGKTGEENTVNVITVDWQSQPSPQREVQLVFSEHNWYSVQQQYEDGSFYWDSVVEDIPVFTTTVTTDNDGLAVASFTPDNGGIYKITASGTDSAGNEVRSSTYMWVSGAEYVNWRQENNDRIDLVADKREYNVGDTATVLVPHPYSGTVKALVTLERGHIYEHYVTELPTNSEQLEIPITEEMIPNMYVSVVVISPPTLSQPSPSEGEGQGGGLPSFKVGYASLPINTSEKQLQITLTPTPPTSPPLQGGGQGGVETYQPGDTVEYKVQVTDAQGQPVKAELSLALVDKAVLTLAPETPGQLMSTFWRTRGLGVTTAGGLTLAIDRINLAVAPEAKGGGGGFDEGFGDIRGEFKDTALWIADFTTDENGAGTVEAKLPDNLTTWTLTGKGITRADTLVGENTVEIVSAKPLLVRPVAPRFFVVGDEAVLGLIVQNNTKAAQQVEAKLGATGLEIGEWRIANGEWQSEGAPTLEVKNGERIRIEFKATVTDAETASLTMGAKSADYGDALTFDLPIYRFSTPETVATAGVLAEDGTRTEGIALPASFDPTQGDLTVSVDPSLAAGMRDGLTYLEHFRYECTEQTVSRFLPNVFTFRAYEQLNMNNPELEEKLPGLVSIGLQRLYSQQHVDGGWGWWVLDDSNPFLTAYVLLGLIEARRADFPVDDYVIEQAVSYLDASLTAPKDIEDSWQGNRQAFILYVLAEAGSGDLGRSIAMFGQRQKLDIFGRAYLAMAIHLLDDKASQVDTLLDDITSAAIVSATGAHWEEEQVDYYSMNTDTRSTAIIIAALSRIQPPSQTLPPGGGGQDGGLLANAVRWLMSVRENGGHWETTQETAWAIIGLTDFMVATGELEGNYAWNVTLNGAGVGEGTVNEENIDETTKLRLEIGDLLTDAVNRLAIERDPAPSPTPPASGGGREAGGGTGRLYYSAYLTYYKPVQEVKALDRGIIVSRQYSLEGDEEGKPITAAKVGDVIQVKLTLIAPNDLHYVVVEDPFPAGTEGVDASLATTSIVGQQPELTRTDRRNPWGGGYGWWWFSHSELRDEKAALFATYLPAGTYEYTYSIRASIPGEFRVIPTHAEEMYFPEVFGREDGGLFKVTE